MGPMRGERLQFNISMNKSADEWKRRGERRCRDQESRPKLEQGGGWYKQLNDKMEAIPDYSSWGINGWELLPPMKPSSSNDELVDLDMESSQDLDTPPAGGSKKLQLEPDHHNHFNKSPPQSTSSQSPLPTHLRREGHEHALNPTRLGQSSRQHRSRVYSKGYEDEDTSPAVPPGGHKPAKRVKLKHGECSGSSSLNDTRRPHF